VNRASGRSVSTSQLAQSIPPSFFVVDLFVVALLLAGQVTGMRILPAS
jgi:hypothetical protein